MRRLIAVVALSLVGCYDPPRPACGFWCGPAGECPSGYMCDLGEGRCFANGNNPADNPGLAACPDAGPRPFVPDITRPEIRNVIPGCFTDFPDYSCVRVDFSEYVNGVDSTTLYINGDFLIGTVFPISEDGFTQAQINYSTPLPQGSYTLTATSEITDLAGNPLRFSSRDVEIPFVAPTARINFRFPEEDQVGVDVTTNIFVDFDQLVTGLDSSTFRLFSKTDVISSIVTPQTFSTASGQLDPVLQLQAFRQYFVEIQLPALANGAVTWSFETGADNQPPAIVGQVPAAGKNNVPVDTNVLVTLDEDPTVVDSSTLRLQDSMGAAVSADVSYSLGTHAATLDPVLQLKPFTTYTVVPAVADADGNVQSATFQFTTGADTIAPRNVGTIPFNGAVGIPVSTTLTINFDEPTQAPGAADFIVNAGGVPVAGNVTTQNAGRTWVFTPTAALTAGTTYTALISGVTDASGNGPVSENWSFVTTP